MPRVGRYEAVYNSLRRSAAGLRAPSRTFLRRQQLPRKTFFLRSKAAGSCTAGCLLLHLWCDFCSCHSSFFRRSNLSRTNSVADVCTYLGTRLCAGLHSRPALTVGHLKRVLRALKPGCCFSPASAYSTADHRCSSSPKIRKGQPLPCQPNCTCIWWPC